MTTNTKVTHVVGGQDVSSGGGRLMVQSSRYGSGGNNNGGQTLMVSPHMEELISYQDGMNGEAARIGSAGLPVRPVVVENFAGEIQLNERRRMTSANYHHSGSVPRGAKYPNKF